MVQWNQGEKPMLNSSIVASFGLEYVQNSLLTRHLQSLECTLKTVESVEALVEEDFFLCFIDYRKMHQKEFSLLKTYFTEQDGCLTEKILIGPFRADLPDQAVPCLRYESFAEIQSHLPSIITKAHAKAQREEATIKSFAPVPQILSFLQSQDKISTKEFEELLGRKKAAVLRYLEIIKILGYPLIFEGKDTTWSLNQGG